MKWKKFFDKILEYITQYPEIDITTFNKILEITKNCMSPKNFIRYNKNFLILESFLKKD